VLWYGSSAMRPIELPPLEPPVWARGGHAQTLLGVWLPERAPRLSAGEDGVTRHEVRLSDGDRLVTLEAAARTAAQTATRAAPLSGWVVHLFHGLTGSSDSGYIRRAAERLRAAGHIVIAANHRGAGPGAGLARGMYHSGVAADVRAVLAAGRARHPERRHAAIGYSLSGNALLLALGRDRADLPDAAIAVNPPVDLAGCVARLMRPSNRLYDLNFVRGCSAQLRARVASGLLPLQPEFSWRDTIRDFDERVTAPLGGFADAADYYARCSARPWLRHIAVPTAILTSKDDPLIDWRAVGDAPRSDRVHAVVVPHGGHMGYLTRRGAGHRRWLEGALERLLAGVVSAAERG